MARKPAVTAPVALDLSAINHETADLPDASRIVANRKWDHNPLCEPLAETFTTGKGKAVTLPAYHVREFVSGLRNAADQNTDKGTEMGVRIICEWDGNRSAKVGDLPTDETPVRVLYIAKARRRHLDDTMREEARRYGFVKDDDKIDGTAYFKWVDAGRPMDNGSGDE